MTKIASRGGGPALRKDWYKSTRLFPDISKIKIRLETLCLFFFFALFCLPVIFRLSPRWPADSSEWACADGRNAHPLQTSVSGKHQQLKKIIGLGECSRGTWVQFTQSPTTTNYNNKKKMKQMWCSHLLLFFKRKVGEKGMGEWTRNFELWLKREKSPLCQAKEKGEHGTRSEAVAEMEEKKSQVLQQHKTWCCPAKETFTLWCNPKTVGYLASWLCSMPRCRKVRKAREELALSH